MPCGSAVDVPANGSLSATPIGRTPDLSFHTLQD